MSRAQPGIHISALGNVGIGDETPYSKLTMSGPVGFHNGSFPLMYLFEDGIGHHERAIVAHSPARAAFGLFYDDMIESFRFGDEDTGIWIDGSSASIGLGAPSPMNALVISGTDNRPAIVRIGSNSNQVSGNTAAALIFDQNLSSVSSIESFCGIAMKYNHTTEQLEYLGGCDSETSLSSAQSILSLSRNGNVGIGAAADSSYRFQVNGHMRAREIVVETGWADYVFADGYRLASLSEVESFIDRHRHLPGIPSASIIESSGLEVGDMSRRFMEKIEELTLYTIEQEKRITSQQSQIDVLIELTKELRREIETIKSGDG